MLLKSPKFPTFLNAMLLFGDAVCEQVLQVVVTLLAQPYPKIDRRACEHMVTVVGELLRSIVQTDVYRRSDNKILKMSGVILRLLWPRVPWAFDERVPLIEVDVFVHKHVPQTSSLYSLWNDVLKVLSAKSSKRSKKSPRASGSGRAFPHQFQFAWSSLWPGGPWRIRCGKTFDGFCRSLVRVQNARNTARNKMNCDAITLCSRPPTRKVLPENCFVILGPSQIWRIFVVRRNTKY